MKFIQWLERNRPNENLIYKDAFYRQVSFVRSKLLSLFDIDDDDVKVINTHTSKSIELPVYEITLDDGTVLTMRDNFHEWKVSVSLPEERDINFLGLVNADEVISSVYFEGFPDDRIYGSYNQNRKQFSIELLSEYEVYAFMLLLKNSK